MKRIITIFTLCAGIVVNASAQTFTQRIQQGTAGQGSVTIHQNDTIDRLVNSAVLGTVSARSAGSSSSSATTSSASSSTTPKSGTTVHRGEVADTVDMHKKVIRGGTKVTGYRVQAFAGGNSRQDRLRAEQIGNNIKSHYGNVPVYVHFYSPRWICRVGNYRTYEEAHQMLQKLRALGYNQASIVKGKITVQY